MNMRMRAVFGVVVASLVSYYAYLASRDRVPCDGVISGSSGVYRGLAEVDADGYVYPIGKLEIAEQAAWKIQVDFYGEVAASTDVSDVRRFKEMKFLCTGGDSGTSEDAISIFRDGELVYSTGVYDDGLQNAEIGFARAQNALSFILFLIFQI